MRNDRQNHRSGWVYAIAASVSLLPLVCGLPSVNAAEVPGETAQVLSQDLEIEGVLTLDRCVEIALERRPSLREVRSGIESQTARVGQAAAPARPQVRIGPSYSYSYNETGGERGSINTDFTLSQTIFDWDRTNLSVRGAQQELEARILDENDTEQDVVKEVMQAYFSLNRSDRTLSVARERLENYERRLQWAKDFYRVGTKAKIEVTRAEADYANARLDLVTAQGTRQRAIANLAYAMGLPKTAPERVEDVLAYTPFGVEIEDAVGTAMRERDDLKAQDVRIDGAETSLALARKGLSPTLTGSASYSFSGENDPVDEKDWRVSVGLSIPVLDGGLTREQVRQAEADLEGSRARGETMRQNVVLEVRNAHTALMEAVESLVAAQEVERQAKETLRLAEGRYRAGVGESLEISDAVDAYARAQMNVVTALYNHKAAEIELKRVMGVVGK